MAMSDVGTWLGENVKGIITTLTALAFFVSATFAYLTPYGPKEIPASRHYVELAIANWDRQNTLLDRIKSIEGALESLDPENPKYDDLSRTLEDMRAEYERISE